MHKLGISVYPDIKPLEEIKEYFKLASNYGCKVVFSSMFSVEGTKEEVLNYFREMNKAVHDYGMQVSLDVNPECMNRLGATPEDISVFHEIKTDILRMDLSYGLEKDLKLLQNPYGILIEFNASIIKPDYLGELIDHGANPDRILVCHNFYPQRYTGMKWQKFLEINKEFKKHGVTVGAFISSNQKETHGVWDAICGLCTVEKHRGLPIDLQLRELLATGNVDTVLIGNAYASEEEFMSMQEVGKPVEINFDNPIARMIGLDKQDDKGYARQKKIKVILDEGISDIEKDVLFNFVPHCDVGDSSEWIWRSRMPRFIYKDKTIPVRKNDLPVFKRGSVVMVNDAYKHYAAEVQIVLKDIVNDGTRNVVGYLDSQEIEMLELIQDFDIVVFLEHK